MRRIHCPKCGTERLVNQSTGSYNYTCDSCGQQSSYTISSDKSTCTCPICTKSFDVSLGNWLTSEGTVIDSFDSLSGWVKSGNGVMSQDTTNYRTSTGSIKIDNLTTDTDTYIVKEVNLDLSSLKTLSLWVYVYQTQALQTDIVRVALSTTSNYSSYVEKTWVYLRAGWNCLAVTKDEMTAYGGEDLSSPVIKIRIGAFSGSGSTLIVSFDELRYNTTSQAICLLTTDDGRKNQYTDMLPILQELETTYGVSLPVTLYLTQNRIGMSSLYLDYEDVVALHAAGWLIANHTLTHIDLLESTDEDILAEVGGMSDWLIAQGWPEGAYHFAYPYGHGSPDIYDVMEQCGILSARIVSGGIWQPQAYYPYKVLAHSSLGLNYMSVADAKDKLLQVATYGGICVFTLHGVAEEPVNEEYTPAEFRELMIYGIELGIIFMTVKRLHDGLDFWG